MTALLEATLVIATNVIFQRIGTVKRIIDVRGTEIMKSPGAMLKSLLLSALIGLTVKHINA